MPKFEFVDAVDKLMGVLVVLLLIMVIVLCAVFVPVAIHSLITDGIGPAGCCCDEGDR